MFELIVVLIILGITTAVVAPRLAGNRPMIDLKLAAGKVAAMCRYASSRAASENTTYCIAVSLDDEMFLFFDVESTDIDALTDDFLADLADSGSGSAEHYQPPEGIVVQRVHYPGREEDSEENGWFKILFYSDGRSSGGVVTLQNSREQSALVTVAFVTGVVTIEI